MSENSVQSPGFINRLKNRLAQVDQRTAFDAFLILLIVVGIITTVYLAGQRQIFRSRAAQEGSAVVVDQNGQPIEQKEGDATVVETQQIRLKIDFPTDWNTQGFLPITSVYAQSSFLASPQEHCAASDGFRYENGIRTKECSGYNPGTYYHLLGNDYLCQNYDPYKGVNNYFYNSCSAIPTTAPTSTPTPTQPPAQQTCPGQCASPKDQTSAVTINGAVCTSYLGNSAYDQDCVRRNTGYNWCYTSCAQAPTATPTTTRLPAVAQPTATPAQAQGCGGNWEGKRTQCSADDKLNEAGCTYLDAWSRPRSNVCSASTPFCWACPESAFGAPAQPPQGAAQPPTATPIPEQTQWIRISLNETNVRNGNCYNEDTKTGTGNPDPREHCMEFSITNPYFTQRGRMVDWWLPNETGFLTIYIGFVSSKGNYRPGPQVKVNYRPKQAKQVGGPLAPQPTKEQKPSCTDEPTNGVCVRSGNDLTTKRENICSVKAGEAARTSTLYDCPSDFPECLLNAEICTPQATTQPTSEVEKPKPSCIDNGGVCVNGNNRTALGSICGGGYLSVLYSCSDSNYPFCLLGGNVVCQSLQKPSSNPEEFDISRACAPQKGPCVKSLREQGVRDSEAATRCERARKICTDHKNTQCDRQHSECQPKGNLACLIKYQWCKLLIRP